MPGTNLIVFRDSAAQIDRNEFARDLETAFYQARRGNSQRILDALVLAGQLESSLWDFGSPLAAGSSALTDALAHCFVENRRGALNLVASLGAEILTGLPEVLRLSEPEGFAYYALHPGDFADAVAPFAHSGPLALVGIRSIGTTLSALSMAQLRKTQTPASRITVRPTGHPYDRKTSFTSSQTKWVQQNNSHGATFLVLDEGPGLSGSSFISVAESLVQQGVAPDSIVMMGTRECDPAQLCAADAVKRWSRFGWRRVGSRICQRFSDSTFLAGGTWRERFLVRSSMWPGCWKEMESLRFLTPSGKHIVKFEGFGRAGKSTLERAQALHESGFGPEVEDVKDGMHSYSFVKGQPLSRLHVTSDILDRIAKYCAYRERDFLGPRDEGRQLREMVQFDFSQVTGISLDLPADCFSTHKAVVVDGRMQPHEWILCESGEALKVDAVQHGDDHFLPGPTDIAWDMAGAIVEWDLRDDGSDYLKSRFHIHSGKKVSERLPYFILAYTTFRHSYCKMASQATHDPVERARLEQSSEFYRCKMHGIGNSLFEPLKR